MYAKIENGEIVKKAEKPTSSRTSNLWLNPTALKEEGWLPIERVQPPSGSKLKKWEYEILKTKVKEIPIYKIDNKPSAKPWEKVEKGELKQYSNYEEQEYVVTERDLEEFRELRRTSLFDEVKSEVGTKYQTEELVLSDWGLLPSEEIKTYLSEQKKLLDTAIGLLDAATTKEEIAEIRVYPQEELI